MSKKKSKRQDTGRAESTDRPAAVSRDTRKTDFGREIANWLFPIYLAVILVGFLLIHIFGMTTPNGVRALFTAINAATLTGFRQNPGLSSFNALGQWIVLVLVIAGSLFSMIVGGMAVTRVTGMRFSDRRIAIAAAVAIATALAIGAVLPREPDQTLVSIFLLTVGAFANCGLYLGHLPSESSLLTHLLILPLTILGGLGLPVLMECWSAVLYFKPLSKHSRVVLVMSAGAYVIGFALLVGLDLAAHHWKEWSASNAVKVGSVLAVQSRTGGLPIVPFSQTSAAMLWVVIILMGVGASPAGTGGGLKTTTLVELFRGTRDLLEGRPGRRSLGIAVVWLGAYAAMVIFAVILFSHVNPTNSSDGLIFNAVSAVSNVGFSISEVPDERRAMFGYSAVMLLGRMVPLMILWWLADTTKDGEWAIG
ncbi:MAG: hypothetical protein M3O30_05495 [Planctomycetota bacterium]|nr:hypothetical protein [Planctomycetota bacterium]